MEQIYKTRNLCLAATLECKNIHIKTIQVVSRKAYFIFENSESLQIALQMHNKREHLVEPDHYYNTLRSIKSRMYEKLDQEKV